MAASGIGAASQAIEYRPAENGQKSTFVKEIYLLSRTIFE